MSDFVVMQKENIYDKASRLDRIDTGLLIISFVILAIAFVQGIVYPPNNFDSMTYHMARIPHWISQQSVQHYPTHIYRQLYQPPFAEFVILHFNVLSSSDYLSNSVQFLFLLFSISALLSMAELLGLGLRYKVFLIVLAVTIPEVILQASSTQSDIVVSFFVLAGVVFAVKASKNENPYDYLFLGLSVGLGVLTKGTAYIYFAPLALIFATSVLVRLLITRRYYQLGYSLIPVVIFLSINVGHYTRNFKLVGNVLGVDKKESNVYSNEEMSPALLLSSLVKNSGLHIAPFPVSVISDRVINKLHNIANIEINNPRTNFLDMKYKAPRKPFRTCLNFV